MRVVSAGGWASTDPNRRYVFRGVGWRSVSGEEQVLADRVCIDLALLRVEFRRVQLAAVRALELLNGRTGPDPGGRSEGVVPGRDDDPRVDLALEIDGGLGLLEDE